MAKSDDKTFQCELISPAGKLLDCRTTSIVFPAHDGQVGILHDHMPMLSQLGLGVMRVARPANGITGPSGPLADANFFVDGGFALVAENSVTIIAYDALDLRTIKTQTIESMVDKATRNLTSATLSPLQRARERERLRVLRKIAESVTS